jgi:hypothetical protein
MRRKLALVVGPPVMGCGALLALVPGCVHVKTDPIKVEPIHIVADINIRVERQLDDFFAFEKQGGAAATQPATTQQATKPAVGQ